MENPNFHLEGVLREKDELKDFEGPLSVILMLLKKNKIEIRDIKIAEILDQYLEYLDRMREMDLEIASEFIQMASYLLYIKTKTLIASDEEQVDELEALIESLEVLKAKDAFAALKDVTPQLSEAYKTGVLYCSKQPEPLPAMAQEYTYHHEPRELLEAILRVFSQSNVKPPDISGLRSAMPTRIVYSIRSKTRQILERLRLRDISLEDLYSECQTRSEIVATFISVLELVSMGSIFVSLTQDGNGYMLSSNGGDIDNILEKIEE